MLDSEQSLKWLMYFTQGYEKTWDISGTLDTKGYKDCLPEQFFTIPLRGLVGYEKSQWCIEIRPKNSTPHHEYALLFFPGNQRHMFSSEMFPRAQQLANHLSANVYICDYRVYLRALTKNGTPDIQARLDPYFKRNVLEASLVNVARDQSNIIQEIARQRGKHIILLAGHSMGALLAYSAYQYCKKAEYKNIGLFLTVGLFDFFVGVIDSIRQSLGVWLSYFFGFCKSIFQNTGFQLTCDFDSICQDKNITIFGFSNADDIVKSELSMNRRIQEYIKTKPGIDIRCSIKEIKREHGLDHVSLPEAMRDDRLSELEEIAKLWQRIIASRKYKRDQE